MNINPHLLFRTYPMLFENPFTPWSTITGIGTLNRSTMEFEVIKNQIES